MEDAGIIEIRQCGQLDRVTEISFLGLGQCAELKDGCKYVVFGPQRLAMWRLQGMLPATVS